MNTISTSPACYLQIKLVGKSNCEIDIKQDLYTRTRQDYVFDSIKSKYKDNIFIWDPLPYMYKGDKFDVVSKDGIYLMSDWHHISEYQSMLLKPHFKKFLQSNNIISNLP